MKTQIEKKLPAKQDRMEETEKLIKLASESLQEKHLQNLLHKNVKL
jgi:hypothetical protein